MLGTSYLLVRADVDWPCCKACATRACERDASAQIIPESHPELVCSLRFDICEERDDELGMEERITPDEYDAFLDDSRTGRVDVSIDGKHVGTRGDMEAAVGLLTFELERHSYWPNVWHVNDHGNTTLVILDPAAEDGFRFSEIAYV